MLSTGERLQPTLPGVEEQATVTVGIEPSLTAREVPTPAAPADLVEDPAARRPVLLQLRQRDAACRVVLRLRLVRVDLGLLLASFAPRAR